VRRLRTITLVVLGVLSVAGWTGGLAFLTDRSGGHLGMTVDELPAWPLLGDYTMPGVALVLLFGILPLIAARRVVQRSPSGWTLTTAVGLLLIAWIVVQIVAIGLPLPAMQAGFLILGIALAGLGQDGQAMSAADEFSRSARS
jgi:hypothetical protein